VYGSRKSRTHLNTSTIWIESGEQIFLKNKQANTRMCIKEQKEMGPSGQVADVQMLPCRLSFYFGVLSLNDLGQEASMRPADGLSEDDCSQRFAEPNCSLLLLWVRVHPPSIRDSSPRPPPAMAVPVSVTPK
jgi:hypothetical protein